MPEAALAMPSEEPVPGAPSRLMPLEVRDLEYIFRGRVLIHALDLSLSGMGVTVVMGPNGAGKSVLLRLLHGLIRPTGGTITWGDGPASAEVTRRQAMVFQKPVLLRRSAGANLDFVLRSRGLGTVRRDALLGMVGLVEKAAQPARLLSAGEQQRLALARALATEPEVLFLDEPTASLDPASTQAIESIVRDVSRRGVRVIFVTHDAGQARRLADDVVFLARGSVLEHSSAPAFFHQPRTAEAAAYLSGRLIV